MNKPQHVLDQDVKTRWRSTFKTCKVLHENQAPVMFYDVRNARNAGDTYKLNKLSVDEWTEVEEIAGCLLVAADASQMMEGGKYATSGLVLPCIAKVIESVDPATKILFPERTVDGQVAVPTNSFQATVMRGRAAMLNDPTKRWIIELEPDLLDFYCVAALLDPRFKDFKFLQSKKLPSKKNILPAEWLTKATSRFKVEFDSLWSFEGAGVGSCWLTGADGQVYWAVATLCFFGFFRLGELLPSDAASPPNLSWGDVTFDHASEPSVMKIHLRTSKCDQYGKGCGNHPTACTAS